MSKREPLSPRAVLSANLKALMEKRPALNTIKKVAVASGLSNGKVGRIYKASHTTDIDALENLARAFDLESWQLMVDSLNPEALPALSTTPVLEQIRSLVAAERHLPHQEEGTIPAVAAAQQKAGNSSVRGMKTSSTLDKVAVVNHQGRKNAKRSTDETVQKSRGRADAQGNARARRRG